MTRLSRAPVKTFSIGFDEPDYDELRYARLVAERFGTEHYELIVTPDVVDQVDDLAWFLDEPFGDSSALPTFVVSRLASRFVKVALSGDGGDELFAGYDRYLVEGRERRLEMVPRGVRRTLGAVAGLMPETMRGRGFLRHMALGGAARYVDACTLFRPEDRRRLFLPEIQERLSPGTAGTSDAVPPGLADGDWLSAVQYRDLKTYLPLDVLTKVDRMSMAHGLETRVPLLDHPLVEFAATVPAALRLRGGAGKHLFKRALRGVLPDAVIDRPKQGFAVPLGRWFRGRLGPFVRDLLLSRTSRARGLFDGRHVERLIDRHDRGRPLDLHLWTLLSLELWCRVFLDTRTPRYGASPGERPGRPLRRGRAVTV